MITNKQELKEFLTEDARASARKSIPLKFGGDEIWKFQVAMRKLEYYENLGKKSVFFFLGKMFCKYRFYKYALKLGFEIPPNSCDKGLSLPHRGPIVIAENARLGSSCRIHDGVTIGTTNGSDNAAVIGNNVFIATGAKIIGAVSISDNCQIGANTVLRNRFPIPEQPGQESLLKKSAIIVLVQTYRHTYPMATTSPRIYRRRAPFGIPVGVSL